MAAGPRDADLLAALGPAAAAAVTSLLVQLDVELHAVPSLRRVVEAAALEQLAASVRRATGRQWSHCRRAAADMLGLSDRCDSIGRTLRLWRRATRDARCAAAIDRALTYAAEHPSAQPREIMIVTGCPREIAETVSGPPDTAA